ncbi:hypothetical protein [Dethiosulfatarculus sandiegensis]|uniref:Uncharacterized protein n=1 Tax=Dethiosulfatarculus sandiegensis TaxID=1429043 RepID=A0A0D2K1K0_9BACT|nr:hypothetical protein [Dethiosulfatarculus sandiegensis]KIX15530.1 hypothetical protein X474_02065 [Dethiosulfatarculus sandiegensis]
MDKQWVFYFEPFELKAGQKINLTRGPRRGDWLVKEVTEHKVTLKCPVTGKEIKTDRFCFLLEERLVEKWPEEH